MATKKNRTTIMLDEDVNKFLEVVSTNMNLSVSRAVNVLIGSILKGKFEFLRAVRKEYSNHVRQF